MNIRNKKKYLKENSWRRIFSYLKAQQGRYWNDVYSEVKRALGKSYYNRHKKHPSPQEILEHWVGGPNTQPTCYSWPCLYVDENGILRLQQVIQRKDKKPLYLEIDNKVIFSYQGKWFALNKGRHKYGYEKNVPELRRCDINEIVGQFKDGAKTATSLLSCRSFGHISSITRTFCFTYRYLTKKEMKKYGLSNR